MEALEPSDRVDAIDSPHAWSAQETSSDPRLDSWKEIAAYMRRDVRTVQRWEKHERLPVHRLVHKKLASVYAFRSELDRWRDKDRMPGWQITKALTDPSRYWVLQHLESRTNGQLCRAFDRQTGQVVTVKITPLARRRRKRISMRALFRLLRQPLMRARAEVAGPR